MIQLEGIIKKKMKKIVLLGLSGSGKTTLGNELSKKFNFPFYDSDKLIETKAGSSIIEIFNRGRQPFFFDLEKKVALEVLGLPKYVFSLGGGSFSQKEIRDACLKEALCIWIHAEIELLEKRLQGERFFRPLLSKINWREALKSMSLSREKHYRLAHLVFKAKNEPINISVNRLVRDIDVYIENQQ